MTSLPKPAFLNALPGMVKISGSLLSVLPSASKRLMRKLAESRYLQSGERMMILTEDNEKKMYEPPEAIVGFKQNVDFSRQMYGLIKQWSYYSIYVWIGVLLFSTLAGAVSPED